MNKNSKIYISGHNGMLGTAIQRKLELQGYTNIIGRTKDELNLCDHQAVKRFFATERPEYVFFTAAVAAGINYKREHAAEVLIDNIRMVTNVIPIAYQYGVVKLLNVCSALFYPTHASIPIKEDDALSVNTDVVDTPYAMAKAVGERICTYYDSQYNTDYVTAVPCNFFGPKAPFYGDRAGVVPSIIRRMHEAKAGGIPNVTIWGSGDACREFLYVDDVADACIFIMNTPRKYSLINVGCGREYTIRETAELIKKVVGYGGELIFDKTKPEGRKHMQLNVDRIFSMGWKPKYSLEECLQKTYEWYVENEF